MSLTQMYPAVNNSPRTYLTAGIAVGDTSMTVANVNVLPSAPNLIVLGVGDDAEIIKYTAISGNTLTGLIRGINGTIAKAWEENTVCARNWTAQDAEAIRENILDLDNRKANTADLGDLATQDSVSWGEVAGTLSNQTDLKTALDAKQNTLTFDATPTANSNNPVASNGVKTYADNKILYFYNQSVSVASSAEMFRITHSSITANTVVLDCTFTNSGGIISDITWASYEGYITFSGTCIYGTRANIVLGQKGN